MARMLPIVLGFAVAGLIGALAGGAFTGGDELPSSGEPPRTESDPRLDEVIDAMGRLSARLELLEQEGASRKTATAAVAPGEADALTEIPAEGLAAAAPEAVPEAVRDEVRKAMDEQQKTRREMMGRRFSEMAASREKAMLDSLTEDYGLTPHQRGEMERILARRQKAIGEFMRTMFTPDGTGEAPDFRQMGKKLQDVRAESDTEIKNLLSPSQYEAFQEQDPGQRMGGPMGFGSGRSGGR